MGLATEKINYRRGGVTYSVKSYTTATEVGSVYFGFYKNGYRYVPIDLESNNNPNASFIRVRRGGATYAVLNEVLVERIDKVYLRKIDVNHDGTALYAKVNGVGVEDENDANGGSAINKTVYTVNHYYNGPANGYVGETYASVLDMSSYNLRWSDLDLYRLGLVMEFYYSRGPWYNFTQVYSQMKFLPVSDAGNYANAQVLPYYAGKWYHAGRNLDGSIASGIPVSHIGYFR